MKYVIFFLLIIFWDSTAQENCKLQSNRDSIKVYTCPVKNSKYKALKVEFYLNSSYSQAAAMILDITRLHRWQYKTVSAQLLKQINESEIIYHTEVQTPSVTNNRDFVIYLSIDQNPTTKELTVKAISKPDYIPVKKKVVRVPFSEAIWHIKSVGKNKLWVVYEIKIDFGGEVPAWVVNMAAPLAPYETFKAMRAEIVDYQNKKVSFITD
jgi:START domain